MKTFEFIDHTADIAVRIYGQDLTQLFIHAAQALFSVLVEDLPANSQESRLIELRALTQEDLLINWLNELIFIFFTEKFAPVVYNITIIDSREKTIQAKISGAHLDFKRFKILTEVKAATHHGLTIKKTAQGYQGEVVFDV